jgi:hypothetical protein
LDVVAKDGGSDEGNVETVVLPETGALTDESSTGSKTYTVWSSGPSPGSHHFGPKED